MLRSRWCSRVSTSPSRTPTERPRILADGRLGLRGPARARFFERTLDDRFQVALGEA